MCCTILVFDFGIGCSGGGYVMAGANHTSDTAVVCVRADGKKADPYFIFSQKQLTSTDTHGDKVVKRTRVCGMNGERMLVWLEHIRGFLGDDPILLMDNLSSHKTKEVQSWCATNGVELMYFPPNAAHMLSPLDNNLFSQLKSHYRKLPNSTRQQKESSIQAAYNKITPANVRSYFQRCKLIGDYDSPTLHAYFHDLMHATWAPRQLQCLEVYREWQQGKRHVQGAHLARNTHANTSPQSIPTNLDGIIHNSFSESK